VGFYGAAPSRAYTAAGSFLRWLGETRGPARLRALYARGDFEAAYGEPLSALRTGWEAFLAGRALDEAAVNLAFARFRGESLFARPCARELAALTDEAAAELRGDPDRALTLYRRCAGLQPGEPGHLLGQARALLALQRPADAEAVLAPLSRSLEDRAALRAEVELLRADAAFLGGQDPSPHLLQALALSPPPGLARQAWLKHAALASPAKEALWAWFLPVPEEGRLELLHRAHTAAPGEPLIHYLLGRRLSVGHAPALARPHLAAALGEDLAPPLREEALRSALAAAFLAGDCAGVRALRDGLVLPGASLAAAAEDWVQRCTFEEAEHGGPLVPGAPFR
ncbi:MAG: tetratricopeptide repeat protein, partial [Deltaproteobacteria bacterium]|nr:tetratricopeptide repeat protein [Deltaproteobacteria bacterium]